MIAKLETLEKLHWGNRSVQIITDSHVKITVVGPKLVAHNKAGMYTVFVVPAALDIPVEPAMHKAGCCNKTDTNHRLALPRRRHY